MVNPRPFAIGMMSIGALGTLVLGGCSPQTLAASTSTSTSTATVTATAAPSQRTVTETVMPTGTTTDDAPGVGDSGTGNSGTGNSGAGDSLTPIRTDEPIPPFTGKWIGHDRDLTLNADRTGSMLVGSGALDGERWALTWSAGAPTVRFITLTTRESISGSGAGGAMYQGATYSVTQARDSDGIVIMTMRGFHGDSGSDVLTWCRPGSGSHECGA